MKNLGDDLVAEFSHVYRVHASLLQGLLQTQDRPLELLGVLLVLLLLILPSLLAGSLALIDEHESFLELGLFLYVLEELVAVLP